MRICKCWFCSQGLAHPARHDQWHATSHALLVAESLDPAHSVPMRACSTCGHEEKS